MQQQYPIALLFSVFKGNRRKSDNVMCHIAAYDELVRNGVPFKEVSGMYKNESELSFIVFGDKAVQTGMVIAKSFNQESVLLLDQDRNATLIDCKTDTSTPLGRFKAVHESIAKRSTGWTFDNVTKQFFICE